jgi:YidC/Oxa1 family membrane protein insertase
MDRRTVLAFALIFVVYMAWSHIYKSMYGSKTGGEQAADTTQAVESMLAEEDSAQLGQVAVGGESTPPAVPAPERRAVPAGALTFAPTGEPARVVKVHTPLYELEISTIGGQITSWLGLEFQGTDGRPVQLIPADYAPEPGWGDALIFRRDQIDLSMVNYEVEGAQEIQLRSSTDEASLVLQAETDGGLVVRKLFRFHGGRYDIELEQEIRPQDAAAAAAVQSLAGDPLRGHFAWPQGIAHTEQHSRLEEASFRSFAMVGQDVTFKNRSGLAKDRSKVQEIFDGSVRFAGLQNKYFCVLGFLPPAQEGVVEGRIGLDGDPDTGQQAWWMEVPLRREEGGVDLLTSHLQLYVGPSDYDLLRSYGEDLEKSLNLGWKLFRPLEELILVFMTWLYRWIPNYGIIIVILSVLTKLMFYPLTRKSTESMRKMQELQPKLKALQEKYKDSREKLSQETMKLYKVEKVNPMAGCLPLLVQSPVFIALYQVLRQTFALRQAPFVLWMRDLSQPDALFKLPFSLPLLGDNFNLLPILMAVAMYLQTKLTPTTAAGGQMAAINTMMPLMMLVFFYNMPSGLVLYWLINTVMTIYQTWRIHRTAPALGGAS